MVADFIASIPQQIPLTAQSNVVSTAKKVETQDLAKSERSSSDRGFLLLTKAVGQKRGSGSFHGPEAEQAGS